MKVVDQKKHGKSRSLLSKLSSRIEKNSIDFDEIQPLKQGENMGFNNIGGSKNSRQGFYDVPKIPMSPEKDKDSHNIIEMLSGISIKDSIASRIDINEELKNQNKKVKTYAGKKHKSRQPETQAKESTKF